MFDVSYAAAWELGRLLALQSKSFSTNLYRWKRGHTRQVRDAENRLAHRLAHLPFEAATPDLELPETVRSWFENLILLEGVPFHYLVPDERMLPAESIRFFQVDPIWIECLVDGAFSIGRVLQSDHQQDQLHKQNHLDAILSGQVSGFLLRSDVVSGWPGLQVDGYDESIQNNDFVLEKAALFELDPLDGEPDLNQERIPAKLEQKFRQGQIQLSKERCRVENREWLISNSQQQFKLIKRENNQIDVCLAADTKFLFSIDGAFETDLEKGKASTDLHRAFVEQSQALLQDSVISVLSWFITDDEHQKHYLIQKEEKLLKVYRDYKLPLLRMARLSANLLICLFEGIVQTVDLHLKPDTLHCGVDKPAGDHTGFHKKLRPLAWRGAYNASTAYNIDDVVYYTDRSNYICILESTDHAPTNTTHWKVYTSISVDPLYWREGDKRTIGIGALAKKLADLTKAQTFSAAEFALEMIEGAEKVRFCSIRSAPAPARHVGWNSRWSELPLGCPAKAPPISFLLNMHKYCHLWRDRHPVTGREQLPE